MNTSILYKFFIRFFFLCVTLSLHVSALAKQIRLMKSHRVIMITVKTHLSEKIFVHTDRSYYLCGNILWFKIYLANAIDNKLLPVSRVTYVEVLNALHQPVLQGKIAMENGTGNALLIYPLPFPSGNYELRAYTNWMKNESPDHYFKKIITIINTTQNPGDSLLHNNPKYYAQFFPEGGNLVNGLNST